MLNKNLYHFPTLATYSVVDFKSFPEELQYLNSQFPKRCEDFRKQEVNLDIFSPPFSVDVEKVPLVLQMELIELQENTSKKYFVFIILSKIFSKEVFPNQFGCSSENITIWQYLLL